MPDGSIPFFFLEKYMLFTQHCWLINLSKIDIMGKNEYSYHLNKPEWRQPNATGIIKVI